MTPRSSQPADRPTNRLARETSPYLLQHAHNPVDWFPWGEEAFAKARAEDKPVLLSVGYATCHWCHVMERESFEDVGLARQLADGFVAIKVDREELPDVDHVYMSALQALTGRGGWPMNMFLTPQLRAFFGGTYFPRDRAKEFPAFPRCSPPCARRGSTGAVTSSGRPRRCSISCTAARPSRTVHWPMTCTGEPWPRSPCASTLPPSAGASQGESRWLAGMSGALLRLTGARASTASTRAPRGGAPRIKTPAPAFAKCMCR